MSPITTYILDTASGKPGAGISVTLESRSHTAGWHKIAEGVTNNDGRHNELLPNREALAPGYYRLVFDTGTYYLAQGVECFFPQIAITFVVKNVMDHYHLPLAVSPFGYSVYRGQ